MKKILCLLMIAALLLMTLPLMASAADDTLPEMKVTLIYHPETNSAGVIWNPVTDAEVYHIWFKNNMPDREDWFAQVGSVLSQPADKGCGVTLDRSYFTDSGWGGSGYQVRIEAIDRYGKTLASGKSNIITTDIEMLDTPVVTFSEYGVVSWDPVPNAAAYTVFIYRSDTHFHVRADTTNQTEVDFAEHLRVGDAYYAFVTARGGKVFRDSLQSRLTDPVTYRGRTTVSDFVVGGITEPVDGQAPNGECRIPKGSGYRATIPNYGYVSWYTEDGALMNPDTDTFEAGKRYSAQVTLIPKEGYEFAESGLTGTMNGKDATKSIFIASPKKKIYMSRWFTCVAPTAVSTVAVSGVVAPKANARPTYSASAPVGAGYAVEDYDDDNCWQNGVCWYHAGSEMSFTDRFVAGETYTAQVSLIPASGAYYFAKSGLSGTLNGKSATVRAFSPSTAAENIYVQYTFTCSAGVLLGDADTDGEVTILDATAIQRRLVSLSVAAFDRDAADADQDGGLTILDATAIQRHLVKLPTNQNIGTVV